MSLTFCLILLHADHVSTLQHNHHNGYSVCHVQLRACSQLRYCESPRAQWRAMLALSAQPSLAS
eukprot:2301396-Pyramimonas_sp.AAC.1